MTQITAKATFIHGNLHVTKGDKIDVNESLASDFVARGLATMSRTVGKAPAAAKPPAPRATGKGGKAGK